MKLEIQHSETHNTYWLENEDTSRTVCDFYYKAKGDSFHRFDNAEQNARDIAHRYNVHEELVGALEGAEEFIVDVFGGEPSESSDKDIINVIRTELAKAKGES